MTEDRSLPMSRPRETTVTQSATRAGQAGFLARPTTGAPHPRLTPLSIFGAATENYGSLAKKSLFVAVLIGVVAVGFQAGNVADRINRRFDRGFAGRLAAG